MSRVRRDRQAAVAIAAQTIIAAGPAEAVLSSVEMDSSTLVISAADKLVTPGLVDPHTHLIFAGNRADEFIMRCQGKTYMEIAGAGGGIAASVSATRNADLSELVDTGRRRLRRLLAAGTTTCEVKTGYGLDLETELRMLKALAILSKEQPIELVPTFMPAHAVPPGRDRGQYVDEIVSSMLPKVAELVRDGALEGLRAPFNDVFCDEGYFTVDDSRRIFQAGLRLGMKPKVHADEFANLGATSLAVELGAVSADHLLSVSNHEIDLLSKSSTVAVLLPGTSFYLNLDEHAPARKMIERGVAVALGSDFNPGSCHIFSLPFIWGLACLHLKMTPEEALTALTVNAAWAIGKGEKLGQIRPGYQADLVVFDAQSLAEIPYNLGCNLTLMTIKRGELVCDRRGFDC